MRLFILSLAVLCAPATAQDMREHMDDDPVNLMVLVDRLEARDESAGSRLAWDANMWAGRDFNKLLLRTEGTLVKGRVDAANLEALWARPAARWWDLVVGARQDFRPRQSRSWLAVGMTGLAPYRVKVEATAYVGENWRTAVQLQTEYELLLTNRLILQPRLELNAYGKSDHGRGLDSGLSDVEFGLRMRYEIRREFAPYIGVAWANRLQGSGDELQIVAGLRAWY
jgi:copper resistance protein B